ncbi:MAG: L-threonylcarbamoyladenylate synthase [Chloroflexota bacterium]|nr:L-threonylcarbamoyladenylate synthase [Chloroflexota bacterium]
MSGADAPRRGPGAPLGRSAVVRVDPERPDSGVLGRAGRLIREGRLVAFPTETVYGLGANALDDDAVRRIYAVKGRAASDPLIVHLAGVEALREVTASSGDGPRSSAHTTHTTNKGIRRESERGGTLHSKDAPFEEIVRLLAAHFWPGPLTLVLPKSDRIPDSVTAGLGTVAVRVPRHPVAQGLLRAAGVPIAAPSANTFTRTSATSAAHVVEDLGPGVDLILDGGPTPIGIESTVVQVVGNIVRLLRPGAVAVEAIDRALAKGGWTPVMVLRSAASGSGRTPADGTAGADTPLPQPTSSPGMLEKHYAPRARLLFFSGPPDAARAALRAATVEALVHGQRVGLLLCHEDITSFSNLTTHAAARHPTSEDASGRNSPIAGSPVPDGARVASSLLLEDLGPVDDLALVGQRLFAAMRRLDALGVDTICARSLPTAGLGLAIDDRLTRAAGGHVVHVR